MEEQDGQQLLNAPAPGCGEIGERFSRGRGRETERGRSEGSHGTTFSLAPPARSTSSWSISQSASRRGHDYNPCDLSRCLRPAVPRLFHGSCSMHDHGSKIHMLTKLIASKTRSMACGNPVSARQCSKGQLPVHSISSRLVPGDPSEKVPGDLFCSVRHPGVVIDLTD
ncbi:uncharacterized protein BO80DRAFT_109923 [Aspergillus ibericus CBS 121593]|uniref:Uncharacterized protein n=1 Tax=Aspergillus ibericus CBS 121593 TaxID=1448316 RepID=A0A395GXA7_9EURO|nr:hypothetical protein BO80DRAFT_109923 [Aspergillus ibericus CBS 121593]RAL00201.1 hypothetical protein BO80DRAFT_109923 [Aspergillus ibericus CBS 121593]